jgi:hypothetical protein
MRLEEGRTIGGNVVGRHETGRTPWSAAGCNKPARLSVEQAVGVVRNGKGGTSLEVWQLPGPGQPGVDTPSWRRWRGGL